MFEGLLQLFDANALASVLTTSTLVVALGEMGDKTQLLSVMLAVRFKAFWPILWGIFVATIINHGLAAALGGLIQQWIPAQILPWLLSLSFMAIGLWLLKPDELEEAELPAYNALGVFGITLVAFFIAEMGDKTQIATIALGARYEPLWAVTAGTTAGMLIANVPAVLLGQRFAERLPMRLINRIAATSFIVLGIWVGIQAALIRL